MKESICKEFENKYGVFPVKEDMYLKECKDGSVTCYIGFRYDYEAYKVLTSDVKIQMPIAAKGGEYGTPLCEITDLFRFYLSTHENELKEMLIRQAGAPKPNTRPPRIQPRGFKRDAYYHRQDSGSRFNDRRKRSRSSSRHSKSHSRRGYRKYSRSRSRSRSHDQDYRHMQENRSRSGSPDYHKHNYPEKYHEREIEERPTSRHHYEHEKSYSRSHSRHAHEMPEKMRREEYPQRYEQKQVEQPPKIKEAQNKEERKEFCYFIGVPCDIDEHQMKKELEMREFSRPKKIDIIERGIFRNANLLKKMRLKEHRAII